MLCQISLKSQDSFARILRQFLRKA
ncbi:hypothetical protein AvCA_20560 [Azotobacter vinelandii CA]|uniref:Uncharacterized protein n=2 Tax=Azotobacter vinelandii TaxID=354 RepID=C1DF56_AZOVD|nr:hypothetical protein Avin_20560 [Azotobacter vinelandii DJ]AGK16804.1 hypothetical protein AvCA_20560 [Azotobacter vinelandii CA]AGK20363.1 hypothetical protein AvCA6_20560 [Azotobacter vinelandii CA6]